MASSICWSSYWSRVFFWVNLGIRLAFSICPIAPTYWPSCHKELACALYHFFSSFSSIENSTKIWSILIKLFFRIIWIYFITRIISPQWTNIMLTTIVCHLFTKIKFRFVKITCSSMISCMIIPTTEIYSLRFIYIAIWKICT